MLERTADEQETAMSHPVLFFFTGEKAIVTLPLPHKNNFTFFLFLYEVKKKQRFVECLELKLDSFSTTGVFHLFFLCIKCLLNGMLPPSILIIFFLFLVVLLLSG